MTILDELAVVAKAKRDKNVYEVALTIEQRDAVAEFVAKLLGGTLVVHPTPLEVIGLRKRKKARTA